MGAFNLVRVRERSVEAGSLPIAKGRAFAGEDKLRGHAIEELMCGRAVNLTAIGERFGAPGDWFADAVSELDEFASDGLIDWDGETVDVTNVGQPFVRVIAAAFDAYLPKGAARHSVAV
ncbi:MAG: hypothetical protein AAGB11_08255 [Pseudomonadota bacterium]